MLRRSTLTLWITLLLTFAMAPSPAGAAGPSSGTGSDVAKVVVGGLDLLLFRPFLVGVTAMGSAIYAVTWPVTAPLGGEPVARTNLVKVPFQDTFTRPLGSGGE